MLRDINVTSDFLGDMVAKVNGNELGVKHIQTGVYEIGHFNFENNILQTLDYALIKIEVYPIIQYNEVYLNNYGVCDNVEQVLKHYQDLIDDPNRMFVISITPILKENQEPTGGWRWHKWGDYIGEHKITTEYLYDEPNIDKVYVFHIYEILFV